jgi:serine/threonine protein kinase
MIVAENFNSCERENHAVMYKTIRRIGASQFATVSECQSPQGTPVALKEFNRQVLTPRQQEIIFSAADRWKKMAQVGLVPYLEVSPSQHYVAMELLDRSAALRLQEGLSDPRLVLHTLRGALTVLAQLHDQGLIHANLKPTNVFFDSEGRVRLSDGLLLEARSPVPFPSPANLKYLAPEQASPDFGPLSPATDLYCIGLLGLELLAGERFARAFQGLRGDTPAEDIAWSQWHTSSHPAPKATLFAKGCSEELAAVLAKLLSKQPSLRYTTARHALQDLPQDLSVQAVSGSLPAVATEKKREALATHIISRPATGIVLAIASGARAGEMIGSNEHELMIGFDHDCFIRFSRDQYPWGGGKVLMRRGPQGWYALRVSGDSAFVNQHALEEKCPLRSGDIIRLTSRGPDIQFTMQSGGVAIRSLVERFLPHSSRLLPAAALAAANSDHDTVTSSGNSSTQAAANGVGPRGTVVAKQSGGGATAQGGQTAPVAAAPRIVATPIAPALSAGSVKPEAVPVPQLAASGAVSYLLWLDPRTWPSTLRNIAVGLLGALVVIVIASLLTRRPNAGLPNDRAEHEMGPMGSLPAGVTESQIGTPVTSPGESTTQATESASIEN